MSKCTYIDGIGTSQAIDTSGEIVDLKGIDTTSLVGAAFNFEHKSDLPAQIVGKILEAKKIFTKEDCQNERHKYYWNKCKTPFLYVMGRLFDDRQPSAKEVAAIFQDDMAHPNEQQMLGFSVEGARLGEKKGMVVPRSIARKITITAVPANKSCVAGIVPDKKASKDGELADMFKGEMELFKFEPSYEQLLEKKEKVNNPIWQDKTHAVFNSFNHTAKIPNQHKMFDEEAPKGSRHSTNQNEGFNHRIGAEHDLLHLVHKPSNTVVGHMSIEHNDTGAQVKSVHVDKQNAGHGTKLYNAALKEHGSNLKPDDADAQEPGAKAIWHKIKNGSMQKKEDLKKDTNSQVKQQVAAAKKDLGQKGWTSKAASLSKQPSNHEMPHPNAFTLRKEEMKKDVGSGGGAFIGSQLAMSEEDEFGMEKSDIHSRGWSKPAINRTKMNSDVSYSHPKHGVVSISKHPSGHFEVKHNANVVSTHKTPKEAETFASTYMMARSEELAKAMEAGSGMAAPSQLVQGAALATEDLDKKKMHKSEWKQDATGKQTMAHQSGHRFEIHANSGGGGHKLQHITPRGEMTTYSPFQSPDHAKTHAQGLLGKSEKLHKKEKSHWYERAEQAYSTWDKKNHFKDYMKNRMPHLAEGEIDAIGKCLALKKAVKAESKLSKMYASTFNKSKKNEKE